MSTSPAYPTDRDAIDAALSGAVEVLVTDACCATCSVGEVPDEARSYAYYHAQDIEAAFAPEGQSAPWECSCADPMECECAPDPATVTALVGQLYIGFGGDDDLGTGRRIVAALRAAGFRTEWNETDRQRIAVTGRILN